MRWVQLWAGVIVLGIGCSMVLLHDAGRALGRRSSATGDGAPRERPPAAVSSGAGKEVSGDRPPVFLDTEVDGQPHVDADGRLIVDAEVRRLFDYFLMSEGQEPQQRLEGRLHAWLDAHLPRPAATKARELWRRYLALRDAAADLQPESNASLAARVDAWTDLQAKFFSVDERATLLAGDEERALALLNILALRAAGDSTDRTITDAWNALLSAEARRGRDASLVGVAYGQAVDSLQDDGVRPHDLHAWRVSCFGAASATRLGQLDAQREEWKARLQALLQVRHRLARDARLLPQQRSQQYMRYLTQHFSELEQLRLDADFTSL